MKAKFINVKEKISYCKSLLLGKLLLKK